VFAEAQQLAAELDPTFLWSSGDDEFGFDALAREYTARRPRRAAGRVALLLQTRRCTSTSAARDAIAGRSPTR